MAELNKLVTELDLLLHGAEIPDYPGAVNGLQLQNSGQVDSVVAAVDISIKTIRKARAEGAGLLIVHHGMFWDAPTPFTGAAYERMRLLLENDMAVYASHIPLDVHPMFGNNVLLAKELALTPNGKFGRYQNIQIGVCGDSDIQTLRLIERVRAFAAAHSSIVRHTAVEDRRTTRRWAVCSGAGVSTQVLHEAVQSGVDTLIVGEGPHHTAVQAADMGIAVIYAGHYATETLGVRALAEHLGIKFVIPWSFVSSPTGL